MVNRRRGEVGAIIDGRERVLCLTLGALAELEDAFAVEDVAALVQRFGSGKLAARDLIRIIAAGLRGGGEDPGEVEVAAMRIDGGVVGAAGIVGDLLAAAFGDPAPAGMAPGTHQEARPASAGDGP